MTSYMRQTLKLVLVLSATMSLPTQAQERLGMQVLGDDDSEFGLLISNWMDDAEGQLFAPGFMRQELEELDSWEFETRMRALQAVSPRHAESHSSP